ncbi:helix-turn-helix domain-containing protein [Phenylobacterium sp.]|uniref:helix-turn-helix domain-containing protein n=1 Tax=Phenylobacterium sp. TaxID=1871053 RepID=UPI002737C725|nr:helix-turn-helix transcriptional regulator [Phenylobacterium sp.]MDP3868718.1 helix-turn-helix transcriptional regulator [Phenylobacterium sp.]
MTCQVMEPVRVGGYRGVMTRTASAVGDHLRDWRQRRRMSQLDLAVEAEISTRHLSFVETGRAQPSRDMLLRLADQLEIPLRERNVILVAAGFAPVFPQRSLDDPGLAAARRAVDLILTGHEPFPAMAVDRQWNLVSANRMVGPLLQGIDADLLTPPLNVIRLSLHPRGLARRTANLHEWRAHILERLRREVELTADAGLAALLTEVRAYPIPGGRAPRKPSDEFAGVAIPFQLNTEDGGVLSFLSATTVFGTPVDVTLSELTLETFFPADAATARALRAMAAGLDGSG